MFFLYVYCEHRDLHVLTHSFPTLRSSDLLATRWRGHDDVVDRLPARDRGRIEAEALEQPQGAGGETVAADLVAGERGLVRSEEHTSELQSLMRISYAVFCLKKKKAKQTVC